MSITFVTYKNKTNKQCGIYVNSESVAIAEVTPENGNYLVKFMCYNYDSESYVLIKEEIYTWSRAYRVAKLFVLLAKAPRKNSSHNLQQTTIMSMAKSHRKSEKNQIYINDCAYTFKWCSSSSYTYKTFYFFVSNEAIYIAQKLGMRIRK